MARKDIENAADARQPGDAREDSVLAKGMKAAARKGPIRIKPSHRGSLHAALGVAQGAKLPASRVAAAAHSSNPALRKKAVFAQNAAGWGK